MFNIELQLGGASFSAQAENESWVTQQFDKFLELIKTSAPQQLLSAAPSGGSSAPDGQAPVGTLASHLKAKGTESNQNKRFLATADWLRLKGNSDLNTSLVAKALRDNHQSRLGNPSECLSQNIGKGFCEKVGSGFYITPEGLKDLGYE